MAETTGIAWTRSTFNPWIGCTEVSPGCDACYARELDRRHRYGGRTNWGPGKPRFHTSKSYWKQPIRWNAIARAETYSGKIEDKSAWHTPGFWPVFPSMCDPFDNEVPDEWRDEFLDLVDQTPYLTWLLLTKRVGNAAKMLARGGVFHGLTQSPTPSGVVGSLETARPNVWLGASIVNAEEAKRDLPKLRATPAAKRFISYEPALGPVDFRPYLEGGLIHQVIVGGESNQGKHKAREFNMEWALAAQAVCRAFGVAYFLKQFGANPVSRTAHGLGPGVSSGRYNVRWDLKDRSGSDPAEWPEELRIQEFPK